MKILKFKNKSALNTKENNMTFKGKAIILNVHEQWYESVNEKRIREYSHHDMTCTL